MTNKYVERLFHLTSNIVDAEEIGDICVESAQD